jgi:glycosyltransferase involved in cell wall biosynthesis
MPKPTLLYTAAHAGFDLTRVPLGGAATLCSLLTEAWRNQDAFTLRVLSPEILGRSAPRDKDLVRYSEMQYARFCLEFEQATTLEIMRHDPATTMVLCNDVSEGPRFRQLTLNGYRLFTIYHVNVVDYFAAIYLNGWVGPATLAAMYHALERLSLTRLLPAVAKLVFQKQQDSLLFSRGVIVPSEGMKRILNRSYPTASTAKIHVVPWGSIDPGCDEAQVEEKVAELRQRYRIPEKARVLITLSRISPEKGQDRLIEALRLWEQRGELPADGLIVILCGEPAYMKGQRFRRKLSELTARLQTVRVIFAGHVTGVTKQAHFRLAELYVFPSRHESYGLTLLEAFRAGLPAVACHHYGAEEILQPEFGALLPAAPERKVPALLQQAIQRLLADPMRLKIMGRQAQAFAQRHPFEKTAARLAELLIT